MNEFDYPTINADELAASVALNKSHLSGVLPRVTEYGSPEALGIPVGELPDVIVVVKSPGDAKLGNLLVSIRRPARQTGRNESDNGYSKPQPALK